MFTSMFQKPGSVCTPACQNLARMVLPVAWIRASVPVPKPPPLGDALHRFGRLGSASAASLVVWLTL